MKRCIGRKRDKSPPRRQSPAQLVQFSRQHQGLYAFELEFLLEFFGTLFPELLCCQRPDPLRQVADDAQQTRKVPFQQRCFLRFGRKGRKGILEEYRCFR